MRKILFQALVNGKLTEPYEVGSELSELHGQGCRMNIGLKDINDIEIFENDVLEKYHTCNGEIQWKGTVVRKKVEWKTGNTYQGFNISRYAHWKVIGNIYENPYLL